MQQETQLKPFFRNYNPRTPFPNFQKPHIIGGFSLEQDRSLCDQPRKYLKYWRRPTAGSFDFDLNLGYDSYIPGPKETNINSLLRFYKSSLKKIPELRHPSGRGLAGDFVCYRGLLTQICITPYFSRDPWTVLAIKYKGNIYLCNYVSPEKAQMYEQRDTEYSTRCCYYGKNFERFVLTEDASIKSITPPTGPLNDTEEFNVALTTKLDGFRILYAAEMDGVDDRGGEMGVNPEGDLNSLKFVEVKTRMKEAGQMTEKQFNNYAKWKLPKWWTQSFLTGVETIYEAFRTRDGHVTEIEELPVREIPKMVRGMWSPSVMLRFGADFLATVNELMRDVDCPKTVYRFDYDSNKSHNVTYAVHEGHSELSFLPDWYVEFMEQLEKGK